MIKQFSSGDITIRPFSAFKHWSFQSIDTSSVDKYGYGTYYSGALEIDVGRNITTSFYPIGDSNYDPAMEPINPSGKYARNVYSLTNSMFYKYSGNPLTSFGIQEYTKDLITGKKEVRDIQDKITVARLKHNVYGDGIAPETITLIDYSNPHETYVIHDDGYTNLYITGSHFSNVLALQASRDLVPTPKWISGSGQFFVTFTNGKTSPTTEQNAKYYMDMGLEVNYVSPGSGSEWSYDASTARDYFQANNEHFGEAISSWYKYIAVGSAMDSYNLSSKKIGYTSIFKYDDATNSHRFIKKISFPFTQSAGTSSSYFSDSFGASVAIRDNTLAVGSPTGTACGVSTYPGYVCLYDKNKGGTDFWGITSMLKGASTGDKFGYSVSVDNDILAVGSPGVSGSSGAVYIFRKHKFMDSGSCDSIPTSSTWHQVVSTGDFCNQLITASFIPSNGSTPTFVSGNITWTYETTLTSSVLSSGDNFGYSLEVCNNLLLVGTNKSGKGYASLFSCSYSGSCPTASWTEINTFRGTTSYGDLDTLLPMYRLDVTDAQITTDLFGISVGINGNNLVIGCPADKAFIPYTGYSTPSILGAAYFINIDNNTCYNPIKTFGSPEKCAANNKFGYRVAIDGNHAAVASWPDIFFRSVDYISGSYVLENFSYQSTGSEDSVLGRVTLYSDTTGTGSWYQSGKIKRNKESGKPYNIYGYSVSLCSDFLSVGGPLINSASSANYSAIINPDNLTASMASTYSGSAFVYNLNQYNQDQLIGNAFYKNGYLVVTNTGSNFSNILTGTGSRGFELTYQGNHTIYEHEYLVSVRPGEFNYSTNPSSLIQSRLMFDVNQDGVFDYLDIDLIMRYLKRKKFYEEFVFDDNGIIIEQDTLNDYSWWGNDLLQTEAEDVLQQEIDYKYAMSSSLNVFTKDAYNYIENTLVNSGVLDIDGDGKINITDGSILALYYFQTLTPQTLAPYLSPSSTRRYVKDIYTYLDGFSGFDDSKVNPEFFGYQASSSYDATGSFLAPYITTIGLYQDNQLVAVSKLGRPIKNLVDWPVNFIVRFDT